MFAREQFEFWRYARPTAPLHLLPPLPAPDPALLLPATADSVTADERCTACGGRHEWWEGGVDGWVEPYHYVCPFCDSRGVQLEVPPLTWQELAEIEIELAAQDWRDRCAIRELAYDW